MDGGDESKTIVVLVDGDTEVATLHLVGSARPGLAVVDGLARLQLAARRLGLCVRVHDPGDDLRRLLDLVGLTELLAVAPDLLLEAGREAEGDEQLGVQEVVEPCDAAT